MRTLPRPPHWFTAGLAAGLALIAANAIYTWHHNRPPYPADALTATAVLEPIDGTSVETVNAALDTFAATHEGAIYPNPGGQLIAGRVTWTQPPKPLNGGWFTIVVLDHRRHLMPPLMLPLGPARRDVVAGNDSVMTEVAHRYPALTGADPALDSSMSISVHSALNPLYFTAYFPPPTRGALHATAPITPDDLRVTLVYIGPDRQVYWAKQLLN